MSRGAGADRRLRRSCEASHPPHEANDLPREASHSPHEASRLPREASAPHRAVSHPPREAKGLHLGWKGSPRKASRSPREANGWPREARCSVLGGRSSPRKASHLPSEANPSPRRASGPLSLILVERAPIRRSTHDYFDMPVVFSLKRFKNAVHDVVKPTKLARPITVR
jgi:hypothetical protein